jgi:RNA polymerase sigma factor (sigma-70 family)
VSILATTDTVVFQAPPRLRVLTLPSPKLDELVAEHGEWLHRYVRRRMANPAFVDDAVQETLLRVYRASSPPDAAHTRRWLATIAKRTCADVWRAYASDAVALDRVGERLPAEAALVPGSDEHLVAVAERARIRRAFRQLPPRHRRILEQQALLGLSYEEIAAHEEASIACVTSALGRARAGFRRRYAAAEAPAAPAWLAVVYRVVDRLRARAHAVLGSHAVELAAASLTLGMAAVLVAMPTESWSNDVVRARWPATAATFEKGDDEAVPLRGAPATASSQPSRSGRTTSRPPESPSPVEPAVGDVRVQPPRVELTPERWHVDLVVEARTPYDVAEARAGVTVHCEGSRVGAAVCPLAARLPGAQSSR